MAEMPNVLFLVVDSLRYDAVFDNDSLSTLPRLAAEGITFSNCITQGISTAPSMTSMLTGRYPLDYGGHWYIEETQPTMAGEFQRAGYTTGAIHSNPNVSRLRNFDAGFDTFEEHILPLESDGLLERAPDRMLLYANKVARLLRRTPYVPAERIDRRITEWVRDQSEPWFCWTQYMDVHGPYLPGDDFSYRNKIRAERLWRKSAVNAPESITDDEHAELRRNYRLEVEYLDRELERFLDELEKTDELQNTAIVVVGDHGDEFFEHGRYGHKNLPYDELINVPLILWLPEDVDVDQPASVDEQVRCVDILPTLLDLAAVDPSDVMTERMVGESLLPVVEGSASGCEVAVTEKEVRGESDLRFGFRTPSWKFLYDGTCDEHRLYDLDADPAEQENVATEHPGVVDEFRDRLNERLESIERTSSDVEIPDLETDPGVEEQLRALGYRD
jgi:arylsulfatase A-like enzyme